MVEGVTLTNGAGTAHPVNINNMRHNCKIFLILSTLIIQKRYYKSYTKQMQIGIMPQEELNHNVVNMLKDYSNIGNDRVVFEKPLTS